MIISFRHKGLEAFYRTGTVRGIQSAHAAKLRRVLALLDVATAPTDLNIPAFRLHQLKGDLEGYWSIAVNGNWRITFRFVGVDVELVNYVDYH
ncbi:type II toxin-antitoxin system RelE/ParE family toxin [Shewanella sp.]|uniref:type II toxin-antitoxin system RelE/ParE family toxin n=1 Tax=Shewanella sp. TaxID=50422 RepID=UPI003D0E9148